MAGKGKPFKPGQSGNLKGRPKKGHAIAELLRTIGDAKTTQFIDGEDVEISNRELLLMNTYKRAIQGESWAVQFIADREEGKALQKMELDIDQRISLNEVADALSGNFTEGKIAEA